MIKFNNVDFSLILPSRERGALLCGLLRSIAATTAQIDKLEVWVALDEDDAGSLCKMKEWKQQYPFVDFVVVPRQGNFSVGYYNRLAHISTGAYIWTLNDDCVLTESAWDRKALAHFEQQRKVWADGIWYCRTYDDLNTRYPCFPMFSREALNVCGWVFHPEFTTWGGDINSHQIWTEVGRVLDCPMLNVKHYTHHNGTRARDLVNERVGSMAKYNWGCASGEANRIRNIIKDIKQ